MRRWAGRRSTRAYDHAELRETLFEALGRAQRPGGAGGGESVTQQLFSGQKPADPMLADAAVALATANGDAAMYDRMLRVARNATDPDLKEAALHALTRFQAPELVKRTLEYAVSDEVRNQDSWTLIALLLERRETQDQAWAVCPAALGGDRAEVDGELGRADCRGGGGVLHGVEARRGGELLRGASGGVVGADAGEGAGQRLTTASICARRRSRSCGDWLDAHGR